MDINGNHNGNTGQESRRATRLRPRQSECSENSPNDAPQDELEARVIEALSIFAKSTANPKEVDADLVMIWTSALRLAGVTPDEVISGVPKLILSQTFFPTVADFMKAIRPEGLREDQEELAWQRALDCIRKIGPYASLRKDDVGGDGTAMWVLERMGWERLCHELTTENRAIWRAEFVRLYRAGKSTHATAEYVVGGHERLNDSEGHELTPALVGRPEWESLPETTVTIPVLPTPACPECGSRGRHVAWCSSLAFLDERKALPAPEGFERAPVQEVAPCR